MREDADWSGIGSLQTALQSVALLLMFGNALLLADGCPAVDLRRMHHDLSSRSRLPEAFNV